jgi:hypothetical protein
VKAGSDGLNDELGGQWCGTGRKWKKEVCIGSRARQFLDVSTCAKPRVRVQRKYFTRSIAFYLLTLLVSFFLH